MVLNDFLLVLWLKQMEAFQHLQNTQQPFQDLSPASSTQARKAHATFQTRTKNRKKAGKNSKKKNNNKDNKNNSNNNNCYYYYCL